MNWSTRLDDPSRRMTARRKLGGLGEGGARLSDARAIPRSRPGCGAPYLVRAASKVIPRGSRPIAAFYYIAKRPIGRRVQTDTLGFTLSVSTRRSEC